MQENEWPPDGPGPLLRDRDRQRDARLQTNLPAVRFLTFTRTEFVPGGRLVGRSPESFQFPLVFLVAFSSIVASTTPLASTTCNFTALWALFGLGAHFSRETEPSGVKPKDYRLLRKEEAEPRLKPRFHRPFIRLP